MTCDHWQKADSEVNLNKPFQPEKKLGINISLAPSAGNLTTCPDKEMLLTLQGTVLFFFFSLNSLISNKLVHIILI